MCRRQVSNAASWAGDRFQMLLHVQETGFKCCFMCRRQVSNAASWAGECFQMLLHVQETQVSKAASCAGDRFKMLLHVQETGLKCCFMCRRHVSNADSYAGGRFQMLLHVQETVFKCSPYAGDTGFKCLLQARVFWLRHLITFLSLFRVRISTAGHNPFHSLSNNDLPKTNKKIQATSLRGAET